MDALDQYLGSCGLEASLLHLIRLRASQINGCAYCLDMHWKDLRALGEAEQRLYSLDAWRECPYYTERERAALAWTEAVTLGHRRPRARRRARASPRALRREGAVGPDARRRHHQRLEPPVDRSSAGPGRLSGGHLEERLKEGRGDAPDPYAPARTLAASRRTPSSILDAGITP